MNREPNDLPITHEDHLFDNGRVYPNSGRVIDKCDSVMGTKSWVHPLWRDRMGVSKEEQERMENVDREAKIKMEMALADPDSIMGLGHSLKALADSIQETK